jgi:hypothetical protein
MYEVERDIPPRTEVQETVPSNVELRSGKWPPNGAPEQEARVIQRSVGHRVWWHR